MTGIVPAGEEDAGRLGFMRSLAGCSEYISRYGLSLTPEDAAALYERRENALCENRRIEFGSGAVKKLAIEFADSPFMDAGCFPDRLMELIDLFYYFKNESLDLIGDDELIGHMRKAFDRYAGDTEIGAYISLERLCRARRCGGAPDEDEDLEAEDDDD